MQKWLRNKIINFAIIRDSVLKRDNYRCVICGAYADTVHHIIERSIATKDIRDTDKNLITLCFLCHRKVHDGKFKDIKKRFIIYLNKKYQYTYDEQIYNRWVEPGELNETTIK